MLKQHKKEAYNTQFFRKNKKFRNYTLNLKDIENFEK